MRKGLATYSPEELVVVVNVCPRSKSVTETFAPTTTAPDASCTVPTIAPVSFWAKARGAPTRNTANSKIVVGKMTPVMMPVRRTANNGDISGSSAMQDDARRARGIAYPKMLRIATFYFVIHHLPVYSGQPEGNAMKNIGLILVA